MKHRFRLALVLISLTLLTACGTMWGALIEQRGAQVADDVVMAALFTICNGASVGGIERFFDTAELKDARDLICRKRMTL